MKENGREEECNEDIDAKKRMKGRKGKDEQEEMEGEEEKEKASE